MINITPLIDVVFVILIAFIVVAPLLELDTVELADGNQMHSELHFQDTSPIQIHVHRDNTIAFNNRRVSLENLLGELKVAKQSNPRVRPQLFHDKKAYFGTFQAVKNSLEIAGFEEVDIILQPA